MAPTPRPTGELPEVLQNADLGDVVIIILICLLIGFVLADIFKKKNR